MKTLSKEFIVVLRCLFVLANAIFLVPVGFFVSNLILGIGLSESFEILWVLYLVLCLLTIAAGLFFIVAQFVSLKSVSTKFLFSNTVYIIITSLVLFVSFKL
jgi:hypothetical protein